MNMTQTTTAPSTLASCITGYNPDDLGIAQARAFIARFVPRMDTVEMLPLRAALGRVLARDILSTRNVPGHDNSALDGYALRGADLRADTDTVLDIVGAGHAGQPFLGQVQSGQCVRIMTGAVMPEGLDTVVAQECVRRDGEGDGAVIVIPVGTVHAGENRRLAGEDLALGEPALPAGRLIRPADLGLLASLGLTEIPVLRRLRVAFFSTGDELRPAGQPLDEGCVYDSNRYTLWAMLTRLGVEPLDLGIVRDDPQALTAAFTAAAADADVIITSGGVSVGESDHTKAVMAELGEVLFWRIAMRPGRPMAIGRIVCPADARRSAILFGLPGNPVAVMVTFYALVRDALLVMSGARNHDIPLLRCTCTTPLRKRPGRTEFQRGVVTRAPDGGWQVHSTGAQGSGVLRSMSEANGLIVLPHDQGPVPAGTMVEVLPFDGLI